MMTLTLLVLAAVLITFLVSMWFADQVRRYGGEDVSPKVRVKLTDPEPNEFAEWDEQFAAATRRPLMGNAFDVCSSCNEKLMYCRCCGARYRAAEACGERDF